MFISQTNKKSNKENLTLKHSGKQYDKEKLKNYYMKQYKKCVENSGGVDTDERCWSTIKHKLFEIDFNDYF